jgi:hypothetical protein
LGSANDWTTTLLLGKNIKAIYLGAGKSPIESYLAEIVRKRIGQLNFEFGGYI